MNIPDLRLLPKIGQIALDKELIAKSVAAMKSIRPGSWVPAFATGGRVKGANLRPDLAAMLLTLQIKPPISRVVVLVAGTRRVLLPAESTEDLIELCREMRSVTLESAVVLCDFCRCDFGLYVKRNPPVLLSSPSDCTDLGLEIPSSAQPTSQTESIWWQRWGGELFKVVYTDSPSRPTFTRRTILLRVGKFEPLPYHVLR